MRFTPVLFLRQMKYYKRYVQTEMFKEHIDIRWAPIKGWRIIGGSPHKKWYFNEDAPWSESWKANNRGASGKKPVRVEPIEEYDIFCGDRVEILVGKDKGKQGIVKKIIKERNWAFVEGRNIIYEMTNMTRDDSKMPTCTTKEGPLIINRQLKLVDPSDEKKTDMEWRYTETGERVRVSVRTGRIIPLPAEAQMTEGDNILPRAYKTNTLTDTDGKEAHEITFEPKLETFEQSIMDSLGIVEHRKRSKTYWY